MSKMSPQHVNESMNDFVAQSVAIPPVSSINGILTINNTTFYTEADSFAGNPDGLLGSVFQVRIADNGTTQTPVLEFCPTKIPDSKPDQTAHLKEPQKKQSIIIDQHISAEVNFFNYLSSQIDTESTFSILIFDQATGQVDRNTPSWAAGLKSWKKENKEILEDPSVTDVFVVIAYVQKYVIRKKFKKFDAKAKGGGYGINVGGELYTSSEDYALDVRYGLTISSLKSKGGAKVLGVAPQLLDEAVTARQWQLLKTFHKIN